MRTVRFFKGVCDTMKQDLNLPADYAVLSDNEMTYTQGGGVFTTLLGLYTAGATAVGTGVYGRALDALSADMKKSSSNFLRDGVSALTVCAMGPLSLYLVLRK